MRTDPKYVTRRVKFTEMLSWEIAHYIMVEHTSGHDVIYGRKTYKGEVGEGETAAEQQPPRASGCEAAMSSRG
jgi:hypothetical protein